MSSFLPQKCLLLELEMKIQKGYRFKLRPTKDQEARFRQFAGAVRWVWNQMLAQRQQAYHTTGKSPSGVEQALLLKLKVQKETAWLAQVHSQVLQNPIQNLHLQPPEQEQPAQVLEYLYTQEYCQYLPRSIEEKESSPGCCSH